MVIDRNAPARMCASAAGIATLAMLLVGSRVQAQDASPPAAPSSVTAADHPWDGGNRIDLSWVLSNDDPARVVQYVVSYRHSPKGVAEVVKEIEEHIAALQAIVAASPDDSAMASALLKARKDLAAAKSNEPQEAAKLKAGENLLSVDGLAPHLEYVFEVHAIDDKGVSSAPALSNELSPRVQFFDGNRGYLAIIAVIVCGTIIAFILLARKGVKMKIRRIAGLDAVEEAVGRATEMGRPVLFVTGTQDMNDMMTIAGLTALGKVARTAAEYDAKLEVPTSRALVMTAARETVQGAFLAAGRPDAYNENLIYYVTDEQFGFVAYLAGHMVRQKPAACFYLGAFFAESLILAETGNAIGAIQIAGTAETAQLPFFVAACDYTLIGEEFFAASAYLSGEPDQLGSLRGQDVGKVVVAVTLLFGCCVATAASAFGPDNIFHDILTYLKDTVLQ